MLVFLVDFDLNELEVVVGYLDSWSDFALSGYPNWVMEENCLVTSTTIEEVCSPSIQKGNQPMNTYRIEYKQTHVNNFKQQ